MTTPLTTRIIVGRPCMDEPVAAVPCQIHVGSRSFSQTPSAGVDVPTALLEEAGKVRARLSDGTRHMMRVDDLAGEDGLAGQVICWRLPTSRP